jgi:hypothetical protein
MSDVSLSIANDLKLNMSSILDEMFNKNAALVELRLALVCNGGKCGLNIIRG